MLGDNTTIDANVTVYENVTIGNNTGVSGVTITSGTGNIDLNGTCENVLSKFVQCAQVC